MKCRMTSKTYVWVTSNDFFYKITWYTTILILLTFSSDVFNFFLVIIDIICHASYLSLFNAVTIEVDNVQ